MADFGVPTPNYQGGDFSWLAGLPDQFYRGAQQKQQYDLSRAFQGGVPTNPDGTVNYAAVMQTLARSGDVQDVPQLGQLAQQQQQLRQAQAIDPMLSGGGSPVAGPAGSGTPAAPQAGGPPLGNIPPASAAGVIPTRSMPDSTGSAAAAAPGGASVSQLVSEILPEGGNSTVVAANIAKALKVQPNTPLSADQQAYVRKLIDSYAQRKGIEQPGGGLLARGLRNNNPDNIEAGSFAASQPGYTGPEAKGRFATFATPEAGLNAAANLIAGYNRKGINTVSGIVSKWAPSSDNNDTAKYSAFVARALGVDPNQKLDLSDPKMRQAVATAMSEYENTGSAARAFTAQYNGQLPGGAPQGQGGAPAGQPVIPRVPLPNGFTDPQQAILAIDREMAKLSTNPYAKGQIDALQDWRDRIAASVQPIQLSRFATLVDQRTGQPIAQGGGAGGPVVDNIADAIANGDQPPTLTGLYGMSAPIRSKLEENGVDLTKLQLQYKAAEKQIQSLNGPQMTRFVGLGNSVVNTIDEVRRLSQQMQLSGVPVFNRAKLQTYAQTMGNSPQGQLTAQYLAAVNTLKEEFANLANGGYAPHEAAWKLADQQINGDYGTQELGASLDEVQRLIKYRLNAVPGLSQYGPGTNEYLGANAAPAEGSAAAPPAPAPSPAGGQNAPQQVTTKAQYDSLPRGTQYTAPDGSVRTKQ